MRSPLKAFRSGLASSFAALAVDEGSDSEAEDANRPEADAPEEEPTQRQEQDQSHDEPSTPPTTEAPEAKDDGGWVEVKPRERPPPPLRTAAAIRNSQALSWRPTMDPNSNHRPANYHQPTERDRRNATNRPEGQRVHYGVQEQKLVAGMIIWHRDFREHRPSDDVEVEAEMVSFKSPSSDWYWEKGRYWYITSVFTQHWNECPLYTNNDKGIAHKFEAVKNEHVGLRPVHVEAKDYENHSKHEPAVMRSMLDSKRR